MMRPTTAMLNAGGNGGREARSWASNFNTRARSMSSRAKAGSSCADRIDRFWSSKTAIESMPWTTAVRIWAFRSIVGAWRTAFSPATGIMRGSILRAAAPSISGPTMCRPARSNCAGTEVWVKAEFGHDEPAAYWRSRLQRRHGAQSSARHCQGGAGSTSSWRAPLDIVRQAALFGADNLDGWSTGMTILTALGNLVAILPQEETYLALVAWRAPGRRRL